jgi:hypothetical protein
MESDRVSRVSVDAGGAASTVTPEEEREAVPCQYLDASELVGKSGAELAELLRRPTVVRGLIDDWDAHTRFGADGGLAAFASAFANHSFLSKRAGFARERCAVRAAAPRARPSRAPVARPSPPRCPFIGMHRSGRIVSTLDLT